MRILSIMFAVTALGAATAACQQSPAPTAVSATKIGDVEAAKIADATVANWLSKDAARIKAMYAADVAGYDVTTPALVTDRAAWDKVQDGFATMGMDGATQRERKIQILSPDVFVMSGAWDVTNSGNPAYNGAIRCTIVYRRDEKGNWPIVAEQCSALPTPA